MWPATRTGADLAACRLIKGSNNGSLFISFLPNVCVVVIVQLLDSSLFIWTFYKTSSGLHYCTTKIKIHHPAIFFWAQFQHFFHSNLGFHQWEKGKRSLSNRETVGSLLLFSHSTSHYCTNTHLKALGFLRMLISNQKAVLMPCFKHSFIFQ